jgi:hypothetical protein
LEEKATPGLDEPCAYRVKPLVAEEDGDSAGKQQEVNTVVGAEDEAAKLPMVHRETPEIPEDIGQRQAQKKPSPAATEDEEKGREKQIKLLLDGE